MNLPVMPPVKPMLAKAAGAIPPGPGWLYEPKWDGFRAIVFRDGDEVEIGSRGEKPLTRYFPELIEPILRWLPRRCVIDGEIVIVSPQGQSAQGEAAQGEAAQGEAAQGASSCPSESPAGGGVHGSAPRRLDFDALLGRIHPAASRVAKLAAATPASLVAFDLLAIDDEDLRPKPLAVRRALLLAALAGVQPPIHLTPATEDLATAARWFERFEGAGLDGIVAKALDSPYREGQRDMVKVKHARTADCVVAGFRWHKAGRDQVGSLLLGLYDGAGTLHSVGVASSFTTARRRELVGELAPWRGAGLEDHPWAGWAQAGAPAERDPRARGGSVESGSADEALPDAPGVQRQPGATSRWNTGKDLSWEPLRPELVAEVAYDHLQGRRFRHATSFRRWRPDRSAESCTYSQLEVAAPAELDEVFGSGG